MRVSYAVVIQAIYISPVLELHKYIKYLNREKNIFWLILSNKIIIHFHRFQPVIMQDFAAKITLLKKLKWPPAFENLRIHC